jgi:hypothetical protein
MKDSTGGMSRRVRLYDDSRNIDTLYLSLLTLHAYFALFISGVSYSYFNRIHTHQIMKCTSVQMGNVYIQYIGPSFGPKERCLPPTRKIYQGQDLIDPQHQLYIPLVQRHIIWTVLTRRTKNQFFDHLPLLRMHIQ